MSISPNHVIRLKCLDRIQTERIYIYIFFGYKYFRCRRNVSDWIDPLMEARRKAEVSKNVWVGGRCVIRRKRVRPPPPKKRKENALRLQKKREKLEKKFFYPNFGFFLPWGGGGQKFFFFFNLVLLVR